MALHRGVNVVLRPSYCSESKNYFNAMSLKPTAARRKVIDRYIRGLKASDLSQKFDLIYILAGHDEQATRLHLLTPGTRTLSLAGGLTAANAFVADRGWTSATPGTDYLDPGVLMSGLSKLTQNSSHIGLWSGTDLKQAANRSYDFGDNNFVVAIGRSDNGTGCLYGRITMGASFDSSAGAYFPGHSMFSRTGAGAWSAYSQGAVVDTGTDASVSLSTGGIKILTVATNGGVNQLRLVHLGSQFSASDVISMFFLNRELLRSMGAA